MLNALKTGNIRFLSYSYKKTVKELYVDWQGQEEPLPIKLVIAKSFQSLMNHYHVPLDMWLSWTIQKSHSQWSLTIVYSQYQMTNDKIFLFQIYITIYKISLGIQQNKLCSYRFTTIIKELKMNKLNLLKQ